MEYEIIALNSFLKESKRLQKKYRSLKKNLNNLNEDLKKGLIEGVKLQNKDYEIYKIRLANEDSNKGKSGGFRVILAVVKVHDMIFILNILSKNDRENFSKKEIDDHLKEIDKILKN